MSLAQTTIATGATEYLLPFTFNVIGFPSIWHDTVYFSASYGNTDNLFAWCITDRQLLLLQSPGLKGSGNYQPAVNVDKIAWTTFTSNGFKLVQNQKVDLVWKSLDENSLTDRLPNFGISAPSNPTANFLASVPHATLAVTKYSKQPGF
jgi:hypothetical protein